MSRSRIALVLAAGLAVGVSHAVRADVRSEERTRFQLAGAIGRVVNVFGGRAAREGVLETVAVKGNRKMKTTGQTGQLIDLAEEKIYDIDLQKKSYKVTTFADLRRQMEEARKRAAEEARKAQAQAQPQKKSEPAPQASDVEIDFTVKNTGEKKVVNGFDTQQTVMTIAVREKGKTLEQAGGLMVTTDMWLTQSIAALKEVQAFDLKFAQKVYVPMMSGASRQDMTSAMAAYPMMKPAMEKMAAEVSKIRGTAVMTVTTMDAVKTAEQLAEEQKAAAGSSNSSGGTPTSVGGLLGGFGRRLGRRNSDQSDEAAAAAGPKNRVTVFTTTSEVLKVASAVTADEVSIPAGFREVR